MKVQLIVVQGKPEGKVIPLAVPVFKIGRGETCHLRPNSELVSREHAEFNLSADSVTVKDLSSRNGTLVNGKAITEPCVLKDRDLVQVGPLTFAVSIKEAPAAGKPVTTTKPRAASPDDVGNEDIESWLVADNANPTPERPSGVYGGDTLTIAAFKGASADKAADPPSASDEEDEQVPDPVDDTKDEIEVATDEEEASGDELPEDFIDESNPFFVKKGKPEGPAKPVYKDSSDAANDILKKMMERRRASKS